MAETKHLGFTAEEVDEFIGSEVELNAVFWKLKKKRMIKLHKSSKKHADWSLEVPLKIFREEQEALNVAEVYLLPEELPKFTRALIEHPILLPTHYSQHLTMERGMFCIRLKSREAFDDFTERLSKALKVLG